MSVFAAYADYYDALYKDKDYAMEAGRVDALLRGQSPQAEQLLELGCGTGAHAAELARLDYRIVGVDTSDAMLARAEARFRALDSALQARLRFLKGDARSCRLGRAFDAVVSLFHVLSYQTSDADVAAMLGSAGAHLPPGGLFLFDFWYGPAVLAQRPEVRTRRLRHGDAEITRLAEPQLDERARCVDVSYTIRVEKAGRAAQELRETHRMRYFFLPELEAALGAAGFGLVWAGELDSGAPLGSESWSACVLVRKG